MAHYYAQTETGVEPRHFVTLKSRDELRPTRITDVKKWWREGQLVVPSVTTVQNELAKHALTAWLIDQHLTAAFKRGIPAESDYDRWAGMVKAEAELQMDKAPQAGTDMHKVLEAFMGESATIPDDPLLAKICYAVGHALDDRCPPPSDAKAFMEDWHCEQYFTHELGFGGCADLVGDGWIIDYKTKQTADKFKPGKMAYDDHRMQLAAYRVGFGMPNARCANIFICLEDGAIDFHEHTSQELEKGWQMFQHALAIWQIRNDWPADLAKAA